MERAQPAVPFFYFGSSGPVPFFFILVAVVQKRIYIFRPVYGVLDAVLPQLHFHFVLEHCLFRCSF